MVISEIFSLYIIYRVFEPFRKKKKKDVVFEQVF